jgi:tetratricopeptide (TPR) repeat protein
MTYMGRFDETPTFTAEFLPLAERLGDPGATLQLRRHRGLVDFVTSGDIDRLEAFASADRELTENTGMPWASGWSWLGWARFLRGDWDEALALFQEAFRRQPSGTAFDYSTPLLFECLAYRGDKAEALELLDGRSLPRRGEPETWTNAARCMLAAAPDGLTILGERDRAARLYPDLVDMFEHTGVICPGYEDARLYERAAGIAAMAGEEWDLAERHFQAALRQAAELPHRIEEAHTRRWYARMLLDRAGPGDRTEAARVAGEAAALYRRMGMPRHQAIVEGLMPA